MRLKDIQSNLAIRIHLRWDLTMEMLICKSKHFKSEYAGFYFCIYAREDTVRLILLHLYPDGIATQEVIQGFPEDLILSAIEDSGGIDGGYEANTGREGNVRGGKYYPINKPIQDVLKAGLVRDLNINRSDNHA